MGPSPYTADRFRHAPPGRRFQARYWRHRGSGNQRSMVVRILFLTFGAILAVLGLLMLVLPGPGILALAVAGGFFASESLRIARGMDWIEVVARKMWRRVRQRFGPRGS